MRLPHAAEDFEPVAHAGPLDLRHVVVCQDELVPRLVEFAAPLAGPYGASPQEGGVDWVRDAGGAGWLAGRRTGLQVILVNVRMQPM